MRPEAHPTSRTDPALPLLSRISREALEEDYLYAAERRRLVTTASTPQGPDGAPRRGGRVRPAVVVLACFGLLVATAAVQNERDAGTAVEARETLTASIATERDRLEAQRERVARIRGENAELATALDDLDVRADAAGSRDEQIGVRAGFVAARGEGVSVSLQPASAEAAQVEDADLQLLVNGLWGAGAEAVAVNGQRLTARSALRLGGDAIRVNNVGIAPPYTIVALGDTRTMSAAFLQTTSGRQFIGNVTFFGFVYSMDNVQDLRLPAAPPRLLQLRSAEAESGPGASDLGGDADAPDPTQGPR